MHLRLMSALLHRLFEHMYWADDLALRAIRAAGPEAVTSRAVFAHILGAEHVWLARLEGRPATVAVWPELSVDDCDRLASQLQQSYRQFLERLDDTALSSIVHYRNSAGTAFDSRIDDILMHVAVHGAYHRGQVALSLRQEGAGPNPTDYIAFIRGAPTATRGDTARS